jgi:uncharacterized protein
MKLIFHFGLLFLNHCLSSARRAGNPLRGEARITGETQRHAIQPGFYPKLNRQDDGGPEHPPWKALMAKRILTASPADIQLVPSPFPEEWLLDGHPQACAREIARSDDAAMQVIVWSCTEGRFRWQYSVDEMVQVLSGEVFVTDEAGDQRRLGPGDTAFFPAGSSSIWHVTKHLRKVAVCRAAPPKMVVLGLRAWRWTRRRSQALLRPTQQNSGAAHGADRLIPGHGF